MAVPRGGGIGFIGKLPVWEVMEAADSSYRRFDCRSRRAGWLVGNPLKGSSLTDPTELRIDGRVFSPLMNLRSSARLSPVRQPGACWFGASSGLAFPARSKTPGDQHRSSHNGIHLPATQWADPPHWHEHPAIRPSARELWVTYGAFCHGTI